MNNTITLTDEQMKALQLGKSITIEPPKPTIQIAKWKPIEGNYCVVNYCLSADYYNKAPSNAAASGLTYQTKDKADSAAKAIRAYARQLAWLAENDDGWIVDWSNKHQYKYSIYYDHNNGRFKKSSCYQSQYINTIFMSEANATKLAQLMNDGIVEF